MKQRKRIDWLLVSTIIKYLFSLLITSVAYIRIWDKHYLLAGILELSIIAIFSNILLKNKVLGRIVNGVLIFFYNAQMALLIFSNSYLTMTMLNNLDSLEALAGKAGIYIGATVLVLLVAIMPFKRFETGKNISPYALSGVLALTLAFTMLFGSAFSPMWSYFDLGVQYYRNSQMAKTVQEAADQIVANGDTQNSDTENDVIDFYKEEITDYKEKDALLPEQPNVILIFTEGLSQNVISDERGIMPNVAAYQNKSFNFVNYYNHTFPTYRGISGQLYSGYQLDNLDINPLCSVQSILKDEGYATAFVNTEPNNEEFTTYLNNMGFDQIVGDTLYPCNGISSTVSDKDAYALLYDTAINRLEEEKPFFVAIYTFGTHASLDSTDQKYGDGRDAELNKFYDCDYQFGEFMKKVENGPLADNTIVIFTTDHATYADESFSKAFPDYQRAQLSLDAIPLFIYYQGIEPGSLDVAGRNSSCLAPTILDYLDVSAPNYFVGTSLYSQEEPVVQETSYCEYNDAYNTRNGEIAPMEGGALELFKKVMQDYYITREIMAQQ